MRSVLAPSALPKSKGSKPHAPTELSPGGQVALAGTPIETADTIMDLSCKPLWVYRELWDPRESKSGEFEEANR